MRLACLSAQLRQPSSPRSRESRDTRPSLPSQKKSAPMNSSSAPRISRKVIIIGSGLHKEVLRNTSDPLSDWSRLLERVAAQIDCSLKTEDCEEPTLAWEKLLSRFIENKRGKPAAAASSSAPVLGSDQTATRQPGCLCPLISATAVSKSKSSDVRFGAGEVPTASDWGGARQGRITGRVIRGGEPPDHGGAALARPAQEVGQMIILPPALGAFVLPAEENRPRARSAA